MLVTSNFCNGRHLHAPCASMLWSVVSCFQGGVTRFHRCLSTCLCCSSILAHYRLLWCAVQPDLLQDAFVPDNNRGLSIPRLELMGVLIGARMATFLESQLHTRLVARVLWTDSKCVLYWFKSGKDLSTFVKSSVTESRAVPHLEFRYIPTTFNPADLATRCQSATSFHSNSLWWHGPDFLVLGSHQWPHNDDLHITPGVVQQIEAENRRYSTAYRYSVLHWLQVAHQRHLSDGLSVFVAYLHYRKFLTVVNNFGTQEFRHVCKNECYHIRLRVLIRRRQGNAVTVKSSITV